MPISHASPASCSEAFPRGHSVPAPPRKVGFWLPSAHPFERIQSFGSSLDCCASPRGGRRYAEFRLSLRGARAVQAGCSQFSYRRLQGYLARKVWLRKMFSVLGLPGVRQGPLTTTEFGNLQPPSQKKGRRAEGLKYALNRTRTILPNRPSVKHIAVTQVECRGDRFRGEISFGMCSYAGRSNNLPIRGVIVRYPAR